MQVNVSERERERVTGGGELRGGEENRRISESFSEKATFLVSSEIELPGDF